MAGERPEFGDSTRTVHRVRGELLLGLLEHPIGQHTERLVTLHDVPVVLIEPRHSPARPSVELEASAEVSHLADDHPVVEDAPHRTKAPRTAQPSGNAAFAETPCDFLESDRLGVVGLKYKANDFDFHVVDCESLLAICSGDDAVAVGRWAAGPASFLVPLDEPGSGAFSEHAAVVRGDHELHAACEGVGSLGDADDLDAASLKVFHKDVRFRGTPEPVEFVHEQLVDATCLGLLDKSQKFGPTARGSTGLGLVDEVLERFARCPLARFGLHSNTC